MTTTTTRGEDIKKKKENTKKKKGNDCDDGDSAINPDATEVKTGHGFRGGRRGAMIDHVLVDRRFETAEAWIDWTEVEGQYPSDHRFVGAVIRRR